MKQNFDFTTGEWLISWPGRVSRYDLVYHAPPEDPMQGIPLGNGDLGILCWTESSKLILALNKCDLWNENSTPPTPLINWADEEQAGSLCHAGRLIIDFHSPVFDLFYLKKMEARLSLADATMSLSSESAFGTLKLTLFVAHDENLFYLDVDTCLRDADPVSIQLEHFGSRNFAHWYAQIKRDGQIGLGDTSVAASAAQLVVTRRLSTGSFCAGVKLLSPSPAHAHAHATQWNSHAATLTVPGAAHRHLLLCGGVTAPEANPQATLNTLLASTSEESCQKSRERHCQAWKDFWMRSLMDCGDDYRNNLWHLTMYYANASQRGAYPGRFINGLWGWNRDVQPWNYYFNWNQQQIYWPLNAAGHHTLVESYLNYRFNSLDAARQTVEQYFPGSSGIFVSDVCDWRGRNSIEELGNHTPAPQIAMDFYRQYCYTGDKIFLRERAFPYLVAAARFFASCFQWRDGQFHAIDGTGYEGWIHLSDGIAELTYARVLFPAVIQAAQELGTDSAELQQWRKISEELVELPAMSASELGCNAPERIFAAGYGLKEQRWLSSRMYASKTMIGFEDGNGLVNWLERTSSEDFSISNLACFDGIFPNVELAPVFPSGLIGLGQRGESEFKLAVNTARLFAPEIMGWDVLPIALARLGLHHELDEVLANWPRHWQLYCNGFGHYGPNNQVWRDAAARFRTSAVRDVDDPKRECNIPFPVWPFRHMGMESMSVLACALNEALLQSHDGLIRVGPAVTPEQNARLALHAIGGVVVSAQIMSGQVEWIFMRRLYGESVCRVANPWERAYWRHGRTGESFSDAKVIELELLVGDSVWLTPTRVTAEAWESEWLEWPENTMPKAAKNGNATLGLPAMG